MTEASLHFLRPIWLFALIPVVFIVWRLWQRKSQQGVWHHLIAKPFKAVLLSQEPANASVLPLMGLMLIWCVSVIALSGPTWQKVDVPAEKNRQASVILFDLSLSMLADDLKPNRLSRARFQLIDLLKSHPEQQFGMVVYAGSAHTITPISEDPQTLINLTASLSPLMMPKMGANVMAGLTVSQQLLQGAQINQGHIIWITDSVESNEIEPIQHFLEQNDLTLSIIAVGTPAGAPIPVPNFGLLKQDNGQLVLATLPLAGLQRLAQHPQIELQQLTKQPLATTTLLPAPFIQNTAVEDDSPVAEKTLPSWLDTGIYFVWLLIPMVALSFRRGWIFNLLSTSLLPLLLILPFTPVESQAAEDPSHPNEVSFWDVLKSNDQQGYEQWQQHNYEAAANQFESPLWKGVSYYRLQKYADAAEQFKRDPSADAQYNLGNAFAQLDQLEAAKTAYQNALSERPDWPAAQQNLDWVEQRLKQQKQQQQNASQTDSQSDSEQPHSNDKRGSQSKNDLHSPSKSKPNASPEPSTADAKNSPESSAPDASSTTQQAASQASDNEATTEPSAANDLSSQEAPQETSPSNMDPASANPAQTEAERAQQNWLNQIPHEPGLFLQRKFEYQFQQQSHPSSQNKKIW